LDGFCHFYSFWDEKLYGFGALNILVKNSLLGELSYCEKTPGFTLLICLAQLALFFQFLAKKKISKF
jgi:hypothetical protein